MTNEEIAVDTCKKSPKRSVSQVSEVKKAQKNNADVKRCWMTFGGSCDSCKVHHFRLQEHK